MAKFIKKSFFVLLTLCLFLPVKISSGDNLINKWVSFVRSNKSQELIRWLRCTMTEEITGKTCRLSDPYGYPAFSGRFGIFVTLKKGKIVRGCYGAFDHRSESLKYVLTEYLRGALRSDPRYEPVDISEITDIEIIVTIADRPFPVRDINLLDISRYGVTVTFDNNAAVVYVPSEIRSIEYLKRSFKGRRVLQITGFRALTIREKKR